MQPIKVGNFMVGSSHGDITLGNEEEHPITFNSGEVGPLKELVSIALSMESLSVLPGHIDVSRFQIVFHEDNTLLLHDGEDVGVRFTWIQGDELIQRIEDGYKMAMNEKQVGSQGLKPVSNYSDTGEPFL